MSGAPAPTEQTVTTSTTTADVATTTAPNPPDPAADAQADKDFEAGFNSEISESRPDAASTTSTTTTEKKPDATTTAAKDKTSEPPKTESKTEPPKPDGKTTAAAASTTTAEPIVLAGLTETQLKAALAKAHKYDELETSLKTTRDNVFGRLGTLQKTLDDLTAKLANGASPVKVTKELFKRLNKDGLEDLADALAEDLNGVVLAGGQQTFDSKAFEDAQEKKFTTRLTDTEKKLEKKILTIIHPDWPAIRKSDEFKLWKGTLPADVQAELDNSWDSDFLARGFTAFKSWRDNGKTTTAAKTEPPAEVATGKDKRLEANVPPTKGAARGPSTLSDDQAFEAGFNEVAGVGAAA